MHLANQEVQVSFTGGPDQGTASEYLDPTTRLASVSNGLYRHDGSVEKRFGVQALASTTTSSSINFNGFGPMNGAAACFTRGTQLLATDGDGLYAFSSGINSWSSVATYSAVGIHGTNDRVSTCTATRAPLLTAVGGNGNTGPAELAVAEGSGIRCVTWRDTGGDNFMKYSLYDLATGAVIASSQPLAGSSGFTNPIPIIVGGYLYFFYADSGHIYWQQINLSTQALTTGTLVSDAANAVFDATPEVTTFFIIGGGIGYQNTGILIVYNQTSSLGRPRYLRLENLPSLTITASGIVPLPVGLTLAAPDVISCRYDGALGVAFIAWENPASGGTVNNLCVSAYSVPAWTLINLGGSSVPFQPTIPGYTQGGTQPAGFINIEPINSTQFLIQCIWGTSGGPYPGQAVYTNSTGAQVSSTTYPYGLIAGRVFRATAGGVTRCYVPFCFFEQIQSGGSAFQFATVYLMDTRAYEAKFGGVSPYPRVVATLAPRQASQTYYATTMQSGAAGVYRPPIVTSIGVPIAGAYRFPIVTVASEEWQTAASPQPVLVQLATVSFAPGWSFAEGNDETYFAGGVPMMYAGQGCNELGFHGWPSRMTAGLFGGGSLTPSSTYGYAFVYSEVDASGLIHRSAPYTTSVTLSPSQSSVQWTIPVIPYTQRGSVVIEVYRTQSNLSTYYYVGQVTAYGTSITATATYTDTAADTAIASNATLYTTGGVLASVEPPSFRQVISHVERLWGIDDTGYVLWYSTNFPSPGEGGDAPGFNESLTLTFSDEVLTAIESMDEKLIAWSADHIWYLEGSGPSNTGLNSDFPPNPILIASDVGCADWRSVVKFPGGVMFQAPSGGIYILGRDLSVSYVGLGIQDTIGPGVSVLSATLAPRTHDIRLLLSTGVVATYDYVRGRWATLTYPNSGTLTSAIVDNAQNWSACSSGGNVWVEKASTASAPWLDTDASSTNHWITLTVTSAHVKVGGLQGYQRLRHLMGYATFLEKCDLSVTATYDYGRQTQGPNTVNYPQLSAANPVAAQWDMHAMATAGQAQAVQVTMSDAPPSGGASYVTGQGCRFLGLSFDIQALAARNMRLPAVVKV